MHASEVWDSPAFRYKALRAALWPASMLYAAGWQCYLGSYKVGLKRARSAHRPVICVGNLQAGGSGKTPVALFLARHLAGMEYQVVLSSSGYGGPRSESASLAPEGELAASVWGDEASMLRWLQPDLPLIVGRDRVRAAEIAHAELGDSVLILDDGFQHLPLKKDLTIVLDPESPLNGMCLPAGPYREPRFNRARADLLVPGSMTVVPEPTRLADPMSGHPSRPERYSILCALGNPASFIASLALHAPPLNGIDVTVIKQDHDPLTEGTLLQPFNPQVPIAVTAKDWVKLRERTDVDRYHFLIATQHIRLEPIDVIEHWLRNRSDT